MPTCVVGMHRSGTSMVARMLNVAGMALGPEEDMLAPNEANTAGYWENRHFVQLNDELLTILGGGWDYPPPAVALGSDPALDRHRGKAEALIARFVGQEPWGWKDPRASLVLPFWLGLAPATKIVLCVRNPLEVASSLRYRGASSFSLSLALWLEYNRRILDTTTPETRRTVHYAKVLSSPASELDRVLEFLDISPVRKERSRSAAAANDTNRHHRMTLRHLLDADVAPEIIELYVGLCEEAGWSDNDKGDLSTSRPGRSPSARSFPRQLDPVGIEITDLEREINTLRNEVGSRENRIKVLEAESDLQRKASQSQHQQTDLLESLGKQIQILSQSMVEGFSSLGRHLESIEDTSYELLMKHGATVSGAPPDKATEYATFLLKLRHDVRRALPSVCSLLVVSRGDDQLLRLGGRAAEHFPQGADGRWSGYHPANDLAAIAHLEAMRARGAEYLVVPAPSSWWFDHYDGFAAHLDAHYEKVLGAVASATIYRLSDAEGIISGSRVLRVLLEEYRFRYGEEPAVLDYGTGLDLVDMLRNASLSIQSSNHTLPYPDGTFDIVVVQDDPALLAEARRVSSYAVAAISKIHDRPTSRGGAVGFSVNSSRQPTPEERALPSVSIVACHEGNVAGTVRCLDSLRKLLPSSFDGEVVFVVDPSDDAAADTIAGYSIALPALSVVRSKSSGVLNCMNHGAEAATRQLVVFLRVESILLPGWLPPLLRAKKSHPEAGTIGGRSLFEDGSIRQAGGIAYADASLSMIGYGKMPTSPEHQTFKEVHFCSGPPLATPRDLFLERRGFDESFLTVEYAAADYCFAMRKAGRPVYYQPQSTVVLPRGVGNDPATGAEDFNADRAVFRDKWAMELAHLTDRPDAIDDAAIRAAPGQGLPKDSFV